MKKRSCLLIALLVGAAFIAVQIACKSKPTERAGKKASEKLHLKGYYRSLPWKQGGRKDAMKMALAGQTIPLAQYSFTASKDGQKYTGVLVGTNPFAKPLGGATVNAVIVPLKVTIGSVAFDPTATDSCDSNVSALTRFRQSPLANDVPDLTFNGVNVGDAQYINGFRRAEFWGAIQGSPAYQNELNYSFADPYELSSDVVGTHGITAGDGCAQIGILSNSWLDGILQSTVLPTLTSSKVISPNSVVLFFLKNIVQSDSETTQHLQLLHSRLSQRGRNSHSELRNH